MNRYLHSLITLVAVGINCACHGEVEETLALDLLSYKAFIEKDAKTLQQLKTALLEKGIVGIKGIPGYKEKLLALIAKAREFAALPEEVKQGYAPNHALGETFLGYEMGKERFQRPDGRWVIDDSKASYYAFVPEDPRNKWPIEVDLQGAFEDLGSVMSQMGVAVMEAIGLIGPDSGIDISGVPRVGRLLSYRNDSHSVSDNPLWCGAHCDLGLFTALAPAFYFLEGQAVAEPIDAGLFVKTTYEGVFKKVVADDPDVLLFQVGEFGQLATSDAIRATEHRVRKAEGAIERYAMALFYETSPETVIHSTSELTGDARYGGGPGSPCSYAHWHEESFKRYLVTEGQ